MGYKIFWLAVFVCCRWLDNEPLLKDKVKKLDSRDEAILSFANSLLKRTLSESFVGVSLTEGCVSGISYYL